nr:FAD-dependent oxidoreductase [Methylobacterium sp. ZNC0032]
MSVTRSTASVDIIVIGGGGSGLMAALTAAGAGRSVMVVEKCPRLGGTTALSVGTICAAATRLQAARGIQDDSDSHFADMEKFIGPLLDRDNPALRRILVDEAPETIRQLEALGVTFMGPLPEPPHSRPRLHAILPHSRGYVSHLAAACREKGVVLRANARATALLTEAGRVNGVEIAPQAGAPERIDARLGVILASGDFSSADKNYKRRFMSGPLLDIDGINPASTGDGQRMAEAVGAEIVNGDLAWGPEIRFLAPPHPSIISRMPTHRIVARALLTAMQWLPARLLRPILLRFVTTYLAPSLRLFEAGAILVNQAGERFCDERNRPQDAIGGQPGQKAWIIMDDALARRFSAWPNFISTAPGVGYAYLPDYARSRPDIYARAATLDGLAAKLGLPSETLVTSVKRHNAGLTGADPRLPTTQGPFHALGPAKSWIVFSEGGLRIDTDFRVLHRSGQPIPGLFAAGSAGQGGVLLEGHGHHLAWAFTSGRLAGLQASDLARAA